MKRKRVLAMALLIAMVFSLHTNVTLAETNYVWNSVPYGGGGYVTGLVFHPQEEGLVYIRTDVGGAYRWDKNNEKWIPLCDMFSVNDSNLYGIDGIAVDPNDSNTVYICAGKYTASLANSYGMHNQKSEYSACDVLKSTDKGETWQATGLNVDFNGNGTAREFGECIAVDPANSNNIYVFSRDNELWYSSDAAENWTKLGFPVIASGYARMIAIDPSSVQNGSSRRIYAGVYGQGVFVSADMGQTWTNITGANGPASPTSMKLTDNGEKLYVTANDGVYVYRNSAWSNITPSTNVRYNGIDIDKNNNNIIYVSRTRGNDGRLYQGHIFRTTNGGTTWEDLYSSAERDSTVSWWPSRYFFANTSAIGINPFDSSEIWASDWYGVWKTDNVNATPKATWTNEVAGLENMVAFSAVSLPTDGPKLVGGVADNAGAIWDNISTYPTASMMTASGITDVTDLDFCEGSPNYVVRAGANSDVGKSGYSEDGGRTWTDFPSFPQDGSGNNLPSGRVAVSAEVDGVTGYPTIFVMPVGSGGYYSKDMGATWNECAGEPEDLISSRFSKTFCFSSDRVEGDIFYAYDGGKLYVSSDGGANFEQTVNSLPVYGQANVKAAPYMAGTVWTALGSGGLYTSSDYGATVHKMKNVTRANQIAFGKPAAGRTNPTAFLYGEVSNRLGIFLSIDMGERWVRIDNDNRMIGCEPMCLVADRQEFGVVYLGTNGRGFVCGKPSSAADIDNIENPTQTVLRTIIDDSKHNFAEQHLTNYGSQSSGITAMMSYNGTSSFVYTDCKSMMRYRAWDTVNIADGSAAITDAVDDGTAYICGWFYATSEGGQNPTVQMISEGAAKSAFVSIQPGKWTFVSAPIYNLKDAATCGVIDTLGVGSLYVDDLCIISTSDGGAPVPTARTYTVAGATYDNGPNRNAKVLSTVFDGSNTSSYINPNGSNVSVDTEFVKDGFVRSLRFAGSGHNVWYLSGAKAISTNATLASYAADGNLYWTAWAYIEKKSGSYPKIGGVDYRKDEWIWICKKITSTSATSEWLDESGTTIWLTDIKLMAFEKKDLEDSEKPQNLLSTVFDGSNSSDSVYPIKPGGSGVSIDKSFVMDGTERSIKLEGSGHQLWYLPNAKAISENATLASYASRGNLYWTAWAYISNSSSGLSIPGGNKKIGTWFYICKPITDTAAMNEWINESGAIIWLTDIKLMAYDEPEPEQEELVVGTVFDGTNTSSYINPNGSNVSVDTEFVKDGFVRSLKLAGSGHNLWYLSGAKAISTNATLTAYAEDDNLYWTAWAYIESNTSQLSIPGGTKKIGEWFRIVKKITDTSATSEWIKETGTTIWLTDIKLIAMVDKEPEETAEAEHTLKGIEIDSFEITGIASPTTVSAGATARAKVQIFNDSLSDADVVLTVAEYSASDRLVGIAQEKVTATTFRSKELNVSYEVSGSAGNTVKLFLWNDGKMTPLCQYRELEVE